MPVTLRLPPCSRRPRAAPCREARRHRRRRRRRRGGALPELGPRLRDAKGEPYPYVIFYLDDEDIRFQQGFQTPVPDGAEIVVVPAIAGG